VWGKCTNRSVSNLVQRSHHAPAVLGGSAAEAQRCRRMRQRQRRERSRRPKGHILRGRWTNCMSARWLDGGWAGQGEGMSSHANGL
jgi:hypothetical protein